ncbi:hypothetical protein AB0D33_01485 [Streptomyces sp. NPDC048404]|uniref:hypothetical protein n=1 Tax=unclassified Streptomyces TaxID=2593676 RepID=UPI0034451022
MTDLPDLPEPRAFHTEAAAARLTPEAVCDHGSGSILLHLFGTLDGAPDALNVLVPPCKAPALFGGVLALIEANGGPDKADRFVRLMFEARDRAAATITAQRAAKARALESACCEAGFRTGGSEHTCGSDSQLAQP